MARVVLPESLVRLFPGMPRLHEVPGATVAEALAEVDRRWPGVEPRLLDSRPDIRVHIAIFVNGERAGLHAAIGPSDEVYVLNAISGG